jgi:GT2 family glycosyltransferase
VCVFVHRHPVEVAHSLRARTGLPLAYGMALWEKYNLMALAGARGLPRAVVGYDALMRDPVAGAARLRAELAALGVGPLRELRPEEVLGLVKPSLHRQQADGHADALASGGQIALHRAMGSGSASAFDGPLPALSATASEILRLVEAGMARSARPAEPEYVKPPPDPEVQRLLELGKDLEKLCRRTERAYRELAASRRWALANALAFKFDALSPESRLVALEPIEAARRALAANLGRPKKAAVVICVHNALEDVRRCLESVAAKTRDALVILVDDGSDEATRFYLEEFAATHPACHLIRHGVARGYTVAANAGLRAATQPYVVLLNSDTVVPEGWLDRLVAFGEANPGVGLFGPVSNAASFQSVPERYDAKGGWAINALPEGLSPDDMARLVELSAPPSHPRVPILNGFCFVIRREVFERVGYLDEETFPQGYGEENDFCLRAGEAGFELAVVADSYVYHAKSKSFGSERRAELSKSANEKLLAKHGAERVKAATGSLKDEPQLAALRASLGARLAARGAGERLLKVLFLMPMRAQPNGGIYSVVQEAAGMRERGVYAQIAVRDFHRQSFLDLFPGMPPGMFWSIGKKVEFDRYAGTFDVVVATIFTGVEMLERLAAANPGVLPAYYIQDYEPMFYRPGSSYHAEASASYTRVPGALRFAKTRWLCDAVRERHGGEMHKVVPSIDHGVYHPVGRRATEGVVTVCAMIRPGTPRRGARPTMEALAAAKGVFGDRMRAVIFGCGSDDPGFAGLRIGFEFENRGPLPREGVAELLRESDVFLDYSTYQAFGRTALEAMACGCAVAVPSAGGADEYAVDGENALVIDTADGAAMVDGVLRLVGDGALRARLASAGLATAARFTVGAAVESEIALFRSALERRG